MKTLLLILGVLFWIILIILVLIYKYWSNPKRKNGPFLFTKLKDGEAIAIDTGDSFSGKVLFVSREERFDSDFNLVAGRNEPKMFLPGGIYYIGNPITKKIHFRNQKWTEWDQNDKNKIPRYRDEQTMVFMVKPFEYVMSVESIDLNNSPVRIYFTVIVKGVNIYKALYANNNSYGQLQNQCESIAYFFVREQTYSSLGGENKSPDDLTKNLFAKSLQALNDNIPQKNVGIKIELGYEIINAFIDKIEFIGNEQEELLKASTLVYVSNEKSKALLIDAEAKRKASELEAEGKRLGYELYSKYLKDISLVPGAIKIEERKMTPGITTLVELSEGKVNLNVNS